MFREKASGSALGYGNAKPLLLRFGKAAIDQPDDNGD
jgi:hypothetical protein